MPLAAVLLAAVLVQADPGAALFDAHGCRACHVVGGVGGTSGPDLTFVGFRRPRAWLEAWLAFPKGWKHDALMPDLKLAASDRGALAAYLASLKGFPEYAGTTGPRVFAKAGCVACHGAGGKGGHPNPHAKDGVVPALLGARERYTREELIAKIRKGSVPDRRTPADPEPVAMPGWGAALSEAQISAVADYVLSLKGERSDW